MGSFDSASNFTIRYWSPSYDSCKLINGSNSQLLLSSLPQGLVAKRLPLILALISGIFKSNSELNKKRNIQKSY
jgi:hypothetical protein